jgi:hypothetical protein
MLTDKGRLYFSLGPERGGRKLYGGLDFGRLGRVATRGSSNLALPALAGGRLADEVKARVEVSVTRIARDLDLER